MAAILGVPSWLAGRRAASDRAADSAAAVASARDALGAMVRRELAALDARHARLARLATPTDAPGRWFELLAEVVPPGGGALVLPVAADDAEAAEAVAWAGRAFPKPLEVLRGLRRTGRAGTLASGAGDGLRWWCVAGARINHWDVLLAVPLGVMEPSMHALAPAGPIGEVAARTGVAIRPAAGALSLPAGTTLISVPASGEPVLSAVVAMPPTVDRIRFWSRRAVLRSGLWLGLMVVALLAAAGQRLRRSAWSFHTQRAVGVLLPWAGRAALSALGVPPRLESVLWLSPQAYSAGTFTLFGSMDVDLGPFAAWFATPFDLLLTALAILASAGVASTRAPDERARSTATGARGWCKLAALLLAARAVFALPALITATLERGAGVELYPSDRFMAASAELVLVAALAMLGLAAVLVWGRLGSRLIDTLAGLRPGASAGCLAAAGGLAVALLPFEGGPAELRGLAVAVAAAATWFYRRPVATEDTGFAPALLRLLCGALLIHAVFEVSLDRARDAAAHRAVHDTQSDARRLDAVAATAASLAADPELFAICDVARAFDYPEDTDERRAFRAAYAPAAVPMWARHIPAGFQQRALIQVALTPTADAPDRPLFSFGLDAPQALASVRPLSARAAPPRRLTLGDTALRVFEARAPIGPPGAPIGWAAVLAPDPDDPVTAEAPRNLPAQEFPGLAGRPLLARYRDGSCLVASDPRVERDRPAPPVAPDAAHPSDTGGEAHHGIALDRIGDTPYRFHVRSDPDGTVAMAGLPAPEPGPTALRFARLLLVALLVGACAWIAARRARWWFSLPGVPRWRRRVKHLLVAAFLFVTVPPLLGMTLFSRGLLASALPQSATTHQLETLEMLRRLVEVEVRETIDLTAMPEGAPKGLTMAKLRQHFDDDWCASRADAIGHDIHFYGDDGRLVSSSRRDLFVAGQHDPRLPGTVAKALLLEGRTAAVEPGRVGTSDYRTGYRVMRDAIGAPILVMAMPTRALQRDAATLLAKTLTRIYAMALTALLAVGAFAMLLARRLSRPMERLTAATKEVATGNLDVRISTERTDELGDLERAFDQMTGDLRDSRARLITAEKESAWREMAQQIAHEVKNPLTPLKLSAQHLQRAYRDGAPDFDTILADATRRIIDQVEALRKVAGRFSAFAGKSTRELRQIDVNALVQEAVGLYDTPEARHTFVQDLAAGLPPVIADADDLRRVLINLVTNALQAMDQGGELIIRTVRSKHAAPPEPRRGDTNRRVRAKPTDRPAGWVGVEIRDNGPGISPEIQERLFEPYFSTKTSGTGLGLWICRSTVSEMGGEISLASTVGEGTSAWVWLPALGNPSAPSSTAASAAPESPDSAAATSDTAAESPDG